MKKINLFIMLFVSVMATIACQSPIKDITDPTANVVSVKTWEIMFDMYGVDTVIFPDDDEWFVIRYDDQDVFDLDELAYRTGRDKWYGEYVNVYMIDTIAADFMSDYAVYKATKDIELSEKYMIVEKDRLYGDGQLDIVFELTYNTIED